ncbi:testican-3 isoform X5 [Hemicordylus capensis]|uniref:testican-3 isoform X5 n=1 Tax=Hemicordylus capensis TaxID=884348 RepID=UPI0023033F83|nr:testican-3 isoform X5 [Hemicordylus capensis]
MSALPYNRARICSLRVQTLVGDLSGGEKAAFPSVPQRERDSSHRPPTKSCARRGPGHQQRQRRRRGGGPAKQEEEAEGSARWAQGAEWTARDGGACSSGSSSRKRHTIGSVELRFQQQEPGVWCGGDRSKMLKVAAFVCVWAAAWCSQAVVAAAAAAAAAATGAGGRSDSGNFLDDKQWLTTISQYDKEVGQWNKFRDVDYALLEISVLVAAKNVNRDMEVRNAITISMDDYFRTWSPARPFDQALDPAKDPCLKMKCSRHKVCVAQDQQTAVCISHRRLTHSMKEAGLGHKQWRVGPISSKCKQCPAVYTSPVCGSDGHAYSSQCKLEYQACVSGKQISVKCEGRCPCPSYKSTSIGRTDKRVCSDLEFREVANRLRDWFKALHESGIQKRTRTVQRPERSRFDTSILPICKDSLGWMFNRLDTNYDLLLDQSELGSIYLDKNEQCTKAFFNSCDTYKDSLISNNEWCYCFQRQQDPPCQTELSNIQKQQGGKKLLEVTSDPSCTKCCFHDTLRGTSIFSGF